MGGMGGEKKKNQFSRLKLMDFLILPGVSDTQEILLALIQQAILIQEFLKCLVLSCGSFFMGFFGGFVFF